MFLIIDSQNMCIKKYLFSNIVIFCILIISFAQAQPKHTLSGKISDLEGLPLEAVSISVKGLSFGTQSDRKGEFNLQLPQAGTFILVFSSIGYQSLEKSVSIGNGQSARSLRIILAANTNALEEAQVRGKSETRQLKEQGFAVNAIDARHFANQSTDLGQVLNRTTGIKMREQGGVGSDFDFSISGLSGKSVKFFLDGIPLEVMGSAMNLNNIPVNIAERIEVYKGVAPVSLGSDALGGSVNIVTNKAPGNYLDISHSYSSFQTNQSALTGQYVFPSSGLVLKGSGFYNYSKNNYRMKDVEVWDAHQKLYVERDLPRFHDRYRSVMAQAEIGLVNKPWADILFIGLGYTNYDKQVQTGVRQSIVYGAVTRDGDGRNISLRYRKANLFNNRLDLGLYATYSKDNYVLADTTLKRYSWDGTYTDGNPETGSFRLTHVERPRYFSRLNANYLLAEGHNLNLNYSFDQVENRTFNALFEDEDAMPGKLGKHILGLGYEQKLSERWTNTFMGKYYGLTLNKKQNDYNAGGFVNVHSYQEYFGYGLASVYKLWENLGIKASYEHTYRLQDVNEVYGDGYQLMNNLDLKPESGDNINLGAFYGQTFGKHEWFAEASGFYRDAKGFIYVNQYDNNQMRYENLSNVQIRGVESELRYRYSSLFSAVLNVTYQHAIDNTKYVKNDASGAVSATYKNKVPNQPWLFGNLDLSLGKNNVWTKGNRLQLNWMTYYTHWFYRSWEGFATANSLVTIPRQLVHSLLLAYSVEQGRYNLSLECRNLTDETLYDNFRLQKPGRAFYVKFRYFLK